MRRERKRVSRNLPYQPGVGNLSHRVPFIIFLDAANGTVAVSSVGQMGWIQKSHAGAAGLQNAQREFVGAQGDLEKPIVENLVGRFGVWTEGDSVRSAP